MLPPRKGESVFTLQQLCLTCSHVLALPRMPLLCETLKETAGGMDSLESISLLPSPLLSSVSPSAPFVFFSLSLSLSLLYLSISLSRRLLLPLPHPPLLMVNSCFEACIICNRYRPLMVSPFPVAARNGPFLRFSASCSLL